MKSIVFTVIITAGVALASSHSALADGKADGASPFGNKSNDGASQESDSSQATFDSVIDELVSTIHQETEQHNRVMSDYDLQRMEFINDIANSPLANTPTIQNFFQQYDRANTHEARVAAANQLQKELFNEVMKLIALAQGNNFDEPYISTEFVETYKAAFKLVNAEAMLLHRAKMHAGSSCSGKHLEEMRNGDGQQTTQLLPNCYETAQR